MQRGKLLEELVHHDHQGIKVTLRHELSPLIQLFAYYHTHDYLRIIKGIDSFDICDENGNLILRTDDLSLLTSLVEDIIQ